MQLNNTVTKSVNQKHYILIVISVSEFLEFFGSFCQVMIIQPEYDFLIFHCEKDSRVQPLPHS